jgi:hypothetical protein
MTIRRSFAAGALSLLAAACQAAPDEIAGLLDQPTLDYAVLVTGGASVPPLEGERQGRREHTFGGNAGEVVSAGDLVAVLRTGAVFHRVDVDATAAHRHEVIGQLPRSGAATDPQLLAFLQDARDRGYDWLLAVEQLQDGPVEAQGINGRWPITLTTWLLFGLGMFIPDHTFESRATLHVTVRDLQTGRIVHDALQYAGPVDLSLIERGSFLGIITSILVPPFWVGDDDTKVVDGVRSVTQRRLLVSLARDLKSGATVQHLRQGGAAAITLSLRDGGVRWLEVDAGESLAALRLRQTGGDPDANAVALMQATLLGSVQRRGDRCVYAAPLAVPLRPGSLQVLVATIGGGVASATFDLGGGQ